GTPHTPDSPPPESDPPAARHSKSDWLLRLSISAGNHKSSRVLLRPLPHARSLDVSAGKNNSTRDRPRAVPSQTIRTGGAVRIVGRVPPPRRYPVLRPNRNQAIPGRAGSPPRTVAWNARCRYPRYEEWTTRLARPPTARCSGRQRHSP